MADDAEAVCFSAGGIAEEHALHATGYQCSETVHFAIISHLGEIIEVPAASSPIMYKECSRLLWLMVLLMPFSGLLAESTVRIGVLAYNGAELARQRWQPTADYLQQSIPGHRFEILPLTHEAFRNRIRKGQLDFILTNPAHYVQLEVHFGATRIATFRNRFQDKVLTRFGAVLFTRGDSDIRRLEDLRGRRLAAVNAEAFGGFLLARKTLMDVGLDPLDDMQPLWLGFPQDDIVRAVLDGRADAGTVRSGILERLIAQGRVDPSDIRVLSPREDSGFPLRLSTALYPEWPLARLPQTGEELARSVAITLLRMPAASPPAEAAGGAGWTIPLDYSGVHEVLKQTRVDPYLPRPLTWLELWQGYRGWLIVMLLAFAVLLIAAMLVARINRKLKRSERELTRHRQDLEALVAERTEALIAANRALKQDIESRIRYEEALHGGCECLQSFHGLITRSDLTREQRLQSILDLMCQFFGAERVLLTRLENGRPVGCTVSPSLERLPDGLNVEQLQRCVTEARLIEHRWPDAGGQRHYLACPVTMQGQVACVIEFLSPLLDEGQNASRLSVSNELSMRILQLMAQWLGHERDEQWRDRQRQQAAVRLRPLTRRERQVLQRVVAGRSSKQIARELDISVKTVELHRSNLLRKAGVASSVELTRLALDAGIEMDFPEKTMA